MRYLRVAAGFDDVGEAGDVARNVGQRVLEAEADAGLCGEMDDAVEAAIADAGIDCRLVGKIGAHEAVAGALLRRQVVELREPRFLQCRVVIGVDHVEADDIIAALDQPACDVITDEPGIAGHQDFHFGRASGRPMLR